MGDGGVSTISSAAGRKSSSVLSRRLSLRMFSMNFMDAGLQPMERRIAATGVDQLIMRTVLDQPTAIDGDDAFGAPHGGKPVGNNKDRPILDDLFHILLDDPLAFIVERA